jgi:hypothetical protein
LREGEENKVGIQGRIRLDFRRGDLNHPNLRIQNEVLSAIILLEVCTRKKFPLKVGTYLWSRQGRKWKKIRKGLYNVGVVENHAC